MDLPPNGNESATPFMSSPPADRPQYGLGELLQMAAALIGEDGQIGPDEQQQLAAFQQRILLIIQRQRAMAMTGGDQDQNAQMGQPDYQSKGNVGPYGTGAGTGGYGSTYGQDASVGAYQ